MVSGEDLRTAMRKFTTGVTLLTTLRDDGSVKAMTANSVTSISLDPPIVLVCVGHGRNTHQHIESTGRYGINVLADDQAPAAEYFANEHMRSTGPDPVEYTMTERGSPKVIGSIAFLDCEVVGSHPYGDHTIFVGEVMDAVVEGGEPLVFFDGRFQDLEKA